MASLGFDNQLILYFITGTVILYVAIYLTITAFGYQISDIEPNGNVLTPAITDTFGVILSIIDVSGFGLFHSIITELFTAMYNFFTVWNLLNIYVFYILFIPWMVVTFLILLDLMLRIIDIIVPDWL